jgi:hypothetical protein
MICLSQRDDADRIVGAFCERYKGNAAPNHPNSNPSILAVVFSRIGANKKNAAEHFFRGCWHGFCSRPIRTSQL